MTTYSVTFKLQSDSPYNRMSRENSDVEFNLWCNYSKHVLESTFAKLHSRETVVQAVKKTSRIVDAKILRQIPTSPNTQLTVMNCACEKYMPTVWSVISKQNCLDLQPTTYKDGWEWYRIMAFRKSDVRFVFERLSKVSSVEMVSQSSNQEFSLKENFLLSTSHLFGKMTGKQMEALSAALKFGYFNIPRMNSTDQIASKLGKPPTTYREHLQKAESKLAKAVEPYIELVATSGKNHNNHDRKGQTS